MLQLFSLLKFTFFIHVYYIKYCILICFYKVKKVNSPLNLGERERAGSKYKFKNLIIIKIIISANTIKFRVVVVFVVFVVFVVVVFVVFVVFVVVVFVVVVFVAVEFVLLFLAKMDYYFVFRYLKHLKN